MTGYMYLTGLTRAYYLAHNKNDDDLYSERVEYDPVAGGQLMARAERIISASEPPSKLFDDPSSKAAFVCRLCHHKATCHDGAMPCLNCRTCLHSSPVDGGWHCAKH